jgi:hypothetical protein
MLQAMAVCSPKKGGHMPENYQQYDSHQKREFWKVHFEQWQQGDLSQRAYCRKHGLKTNHFYYWRRRVLTPQADVSFLPVALPESVTSRQKATAVRIHAPNGFVVELNRPHDIQDIQELVCLVAAL